MLLKKGIVKTVVCTNIDDNLSETERTNIRPELYHPDSTGEQTGVALESCLMLV